LFNCPQHEAYEGLSIQQIADNVQQPPFDVVLDLLADGQDQFHQISWIGKNFSTSDTRTLLGEAYAGVISDAMTHGRTGALKNLKWSPSTWGWAVGFLAEYGQDNLLGLTEAIRRLTQLPADRLGLSDRGSIRVGSSADLVAFDPKSLSDNSSLHRPVAAPSGIAHVWVNGVCAVRGGCLTGMRGGRVLT
jgi:N-acyl-D-amino-acid deacylase